MVKNILVTGGAGYIGTALIPLLLEEGHNVVVFDNLMQGQLNIKDAINKKIDFIDKKNGKEYKLNNKTAVLIVRPRGLHLDEKKCNYRRKKNIWNFF